MRIARAIIPAALLISGNASAQTREEMFAVRASVVEDCEVDARDLDFGVYDGEEAKRAQTVITLRCTAGASARVSLSAGSSGNPRNRHMQGPGTLGYKLFTDAAFRDEIITTLPIFWLWGRDNDGQPVPFVVWGEIENGQEVPQGIYIDNIRVTVQF